MPIVSPKLPRGRWKPVKETYWKPSIVGYRLREEWSWNKRKRASSHRRRRRRRPMARSLVPKTRISIAFANGWKKKQEQAHRTREDSNVTGGKPDGDWLPLRNPTPLVDEPWFTGWKKWDTSKGFTTSDSSAYVLLDAVMQPLSGMVVLSRNVTIM
jgi:hypothetical protein